MFQLSERRLPPRHIKFSEQLENSTSLPAGECRKKAAAQADARKRITILLLSLPLLRDPVYRFHLFTTMWTALNSLAGHYSSTQTVPF